MKFLSLILLVTSFTQVYASADVDPLTVPHAFLKVEESTKKVFGSGKSVSSYGTWSTPRVSGTLELGGVEYIAGPYTAPSFAQMQNYVYQITWSMIVSNPGGWNLEIKGCAYDVYNRFVGCADLNPFSYGSFTNLDFPTTWKYSISFKVNGGVPGARIYNPPTISNAGLRIYYK